MEAETDVDDEQAPDNGKETCRDGGICCHRCNGHCFRQLYCLPLAESGLDENWDNV